MAGFTTYGLQQLFAVGIGAQPMPTLYVALYVGSADPAGPPVELTLAGYARAEVSFAEVTTDDYASAFDVVIGPLAAGSYRGVAVHDDPTLNQAWFWNDEGSSITIPAASLVTFTAGTLAPERV